MVERALALDEDPVAERLALLDQPLDGALGEVADEPVDRDAPALDHHPGLAGRHEDARCRPRPGRPGAARARPTSCRSRSRVPTVRITRLPGHVAAPDGGLHPLGRAPVVDDRRSPCRGRGRELGVVAEERVQARLDVEPGRDGLEDDRPPRLRAAGRRSARCRSAGRRAGWASASASSRVATIGMSWPGRKSATFWPAWVESRTATTSSRP